MSKTTAHTLFTKEEEAVAAFAEVIIPLALPKTFTWEVPAHLQEKVMEGVRVEVNLGKSKKYAGIIKRVHRERPLLYEVKEILNVLDAEPVLFEEQLKLWEWMADYYMCTEGEVMAAALPAHFKLSSETILVFNEEYGEDFADLDHDEFIVAEALLLRKELKLAEVQQLLDITHVYPVIDKLIQKKVCHVWEALKNNYAPRKESYVVLEKKYENEEDLEELLNNDKKLQRAEKQVQLLLSYLHFIKLQGEVSKAALLKKAGASEAQLKGLVEKGIVRVEKRNIDRITILPKDIRIDFDLSVAQQEAFEAIQQSFTEKQVCLLHGVTSSGKTNIYIKLIEEYIRKGKQVLYMLPEIALTAQIIRRLQKHFGGYIGIYHSKFSQNERVEIWNKVKKGELKVVLGARSSLFLPFQDLALLICDEEHDSSYKQQEPAPRYQGRDAAIYLATRFGAKVLLGSATPSLESYHNATTGKYGLVTLSQRFGDTILPAIHMIDKRKIAQQPGEKMILTPPLIAAIHEIIAKEKQVILFQNRRGYAPYQVCSECNWVPQCRHCDVSLTFHKLTNKLMCHYCGTTYAPLHTCVRCGSHSFVQRNFGTERIEELLQETFPQAKVGRMDIDTVRGKNAHDVLIQQFEQGRINILVGTQMVVKGLDFDNVEMVGILDADGLLHFADFRVNEKAFQLMEQVSGRAGRKETEGKVWIQTAQPDHPVLHYVQQHAYEKMFSDELAKRKQFFYPPYSRLIHVTFRHKLKEIAATGAALLADGLRNKYDQYMTGPAEPIIGRIRNQYHMELLFKLPRDNRTIVQCKEDIFKQIAILQQEQRYRSLIITPDVDMA